MQSIDTMKTITENKVLSKLISLIFVIGLLSLSACNPKLEAPELDNAPDQVYTQDVVIAVLSFNNAGGEKITNCSAASLPTGLSVAKTADSKTCEITGTPTVVQAATTHTITATNTTGSDTATVSIEVKAPVPPLVLPALDNASAQVYTKDAVIATLAFNNTGGEELINCSVDSLPAGLSVAKSADSKTCEVTGTPTTVQAVATHTITATNAAGSDTATVSIEVKAPVPPLALPVLANATAQIYTKDAAIVTLVFNNTGGEELTNCSVDSLPTGLSVAKSADDKTCEITGTPTEVQVATTHTVTVTNATGSDFASVDIEVNVLQNKNWGSAIEISKDSQTENILTIQSDIDAKGNAIVVWQETLPPAAAVANFGVFQSIKVSRYNALEDTWSVAIDLEGGITTSEKKVQNVQPDIAMNAKGDAIAVWVHYEDHYKLSENKRYVKSLMVKHYSSTTNQWGDAGILYSTSVEIDLNARGRIISPKIALNEDGSAIIVWSQQERGGGDNSIYTITYTPGNGWVNRKLHTVIDYGNSERADVGIDSEGNAILAWIQKDIVSINGVPELFASLYTSNTSTWSSPERMSPMGDRVFETQVLLDSQSNATVLWPGSGQISGIFTKRHDVGTGIWGTVNKLNVSSNLQATRPSMAMDGSDNIIATWMRSGDIISSQYSAIDDNWSAPEIAVGMIRNYQLSVDQQGNAMLIWRSYSDNARVNTPYSKRYKAGIGWDSEVTELETSINRGNSFLMQLLNTDNGDYIAIWRDEKRVLVDSNFVTTYSIRAAHYK